MRLRKDQIKKVSQVILDHLKEKSLIKLKVEVPKVLERIEGAITGNLEAEDKFDEEVQQIMEQYRPQIQAGNLNERELFLKIRKELAKKKKIVL